MYLTICVVVIVVVVLLLLLLLKVHTIKLHLNDILQLSAEAN